MHPNNIKPTQSCGISPHSEIQEIKSFYHRGRLWKQITRIAARTPNQRWKRLGTKEVKTEIHNLHYTKTSNEIKNSWHFKLNGKNAFENKTSNRRNEIGKERGK